MSWRRQRRHLWSNNFAPSKKEKIWHKDKKSSARVVGQLWNFLVKTAPGTHRAMFKLGGKNLIVLCLLIKIVSAVSSADRCNSKESEKAVWDLNWIGGDISSDTAHNSEHFSHFRFPIPVANWQFLIKVWTYVIGLSCLLRTMLEYQKVRQV